MTNTNSKAGSANANSGKSPQRDLAQMNIMIIATKSAMESCAGCVEEMNRLESRLAELEAKRDKILQSL